MPCASYNIYNLNTTCKATKLILCACFFKKGTTHCSRNMPMSQTLSFLVIIDKERPLLHITQFLEENFGWFTCSQWKFRANKIHASDFKDSNIHCILKYKNIKVNFCMGVKELKELSLGNIVLAHFKWSLSYYVRTIFKIHNKGIWPFKSMK